VTNIRHCKLGKERQKKKSENKSNKHIEEINWNLTEPEVCLKKELELLQTPIKTVFHKIVTIEEARQTF